MTEYHDWLNTKISEGRALGLKIDPSKRTLRPLLAKDFHGRSEDEIEEMSEILCALALHGFTERLEH